jgi:hypothetical protein
MRQSGRPLTGAAASLGSAEQIPPGGSSDSHRHTYASLLEKPANARFIVGTFASLPAGSAAMDGTIAYDTTNNRIVYYEAGVRRASAGAMAVV